MDRGWGCYTLYHDVNPADKKSGNVDSFFKCAHHIGLWNLQIKQADPLYYLGLKITDQA